MENSSVCLSISDDGKGIIKNDNKNHQTFGLSGPLYSSYYNCRLHAWTCSRLGNNHNKNWGTLSAHESPWECM